MGMTKEVAEEIRRLTGIADNEEARPESRILAVRRLLRISNFSYDGQRLARRIAKIYLTNDDVSSAVRKKAANLLTYLLDKQNTEEDKDDSEALVPGATQPVAVSKLRSLAEINDGWDDPLVPRKFITYRKPEDLAAFGIPADSDFAPTEKLLGQTAKVTLDNNGAVYWVRFAEGLREENSILNPRYIAAYKAWKLKRLPPNTLPEKHDDWFMRFSSWEEVQTMPALAARVGRSWPQGSTFRDRQHASGEVEQWEETFAYELYLEIWIGHRYASGDYPCSLMWTPNYGYIDGKYNSGKPQEVVCQ
jgi:hypothetical protein